MSVRVLARTGTGSGARRRAPLCVAAVGLIALLLSAGAANAGIIVTSGLVEAPETFATTSDCSPIEGKRRKTKGEPSTCTEQSQAFEVVQETLQSQGVEPGDEDEALVHEELGDLEQSPDGWDCADLGGGVEYCEPDPTAAHGASPGAAHGGGLGADSADGAWEGDAAGCHAGGPGGPAAALLALLALAWFAHIRRRRAA